MSGMWVEGNCERSGTERTGAGDDLVDNPLVAAMNSIEVTDGGNGRPEGEWKFSERTEDLHAAGGRTLHQAISKVS
jgi:hypothetical protein